MKFNPNVFWNLTLYEAELVVKGDRERQEQDFMVQTYAVMNGIGLTFGGKGFKFINPFNNKQENSEKPQRTRDDLLKELQEVKARFNK